jgi:uncharacterized delta-60 repeat protein
MRVLLAIVLLALTASPAMAAPGEVDPTFGDSGWVLGAAPPADIQAMERMADGRLVGLGGRWRVGDRELAIARLQPDGTLDASFHDDGVLGPSLVQPLGAREPQLAVQPDGKVLVAGSRYGATHDIFVIERYLPDGSFDPDFATGGRLELHLVPGSVRETLTALELTPDGRILLGGMAGDERGRDGSIVPDFLVFARLLPDGSLDGSFGEGGVAVHSLERRSYPDAPHELVLTGDGGFLAVGGSRKSRYPSRYGRGQPSVARFLADGRIDPSYGKSGLAVLRNPDAAGDFVDAVLLPGGRLVALHDETGLGVDRLTLRRFTTGGRLDRRFGRGGVALLRAPSNWSHAGEEEVVRQPDGKFLVVAELRSCASRGGCSFRSVLGRLTPEGQPDREFGTGGLVSAQGGDITDIYGQTGQAVTMGTVLVDPDERPLIGGGTYLQTSDYGPAYALGRLQDSVAPHFTPLPATLAASDEGALSAIEVRCLREAGPTCAGRLTLTAQYLNRGRRRSYVAATADFEMAVGESAEVVAQLGQRAREQLEREGSLRVGGVLRVRDATGNSGVRRRAVQIVPAA